MTWASRQRDDARLGRIIDVQKLPAWCDHQNAVPLADVSGRKAHRGGHQVMWCPRCEETYWAPDDDTPAAT